MLDGLQHSASSKRRHVGVHLRSKENGYSASRSDDIYNLISPAGSRQIIVTDKFHTKFLVYRE
jgi:hypothetical protein